MFSGVSSSGGGIRITAGNAGEMSDSCRGGAESGALDIQCGAKWREIRELILACSDLPAKVQQKLIALGDAEGVV